MCYINKILKKIQFKSRVESLLQVLVYFKNLEVEGYCSYYWKLKAFVLVLGGLRLLLLSLKVEGLWFMFHEMFTYIL